MIYTDGVHLITDGGPEELHRFAKAIGLKRKWYQGNPRHPHYDLTSPRMVHKAVKSGAKQVDRRELVRIITAETAHSGSRGRVAPFRLKIAIANRKARPVASRL